MKVNYMKRNILIFVSVLFIFSATYVGHSAYSLMSDDIHGVLRSVDNPNYPPKIVEYYLFKFRGNKEDIEFMEHVAGLTVLFNRDYGFTDNEDKVSDDTKKYVEFFLKKGFSIDAIDGTGYSSLHHSIILNRTDAVRYLLSQGADPNVKVGTQPNVFLPVSKSVENSLLQGEIAGLNALELAQYVAKVSDQDLSAIVEVLNQ